MEIIDYNHRIKYIMVFILQVILLFFLVETNVEASIEKNKDYRDTKYGNYFEVINNEAIVYDNRGNSGLVEIGKLVKGGTYKIVSDYGNWHRIEFGSHFGYVHKENTLPGNMSSIPNLNKSYKNTTEIFKTNVDVIVYDNTSGKLIPFAELEKDTEHEIVSDYGNWYRILVANRVGYVKKSDVTREFTKYTRYFEVVKEKTPVYDNRSGTLIQMGVLEKGQAYERHSDYGNWHRIKFGDIYGYVRKSDTVPTNEGSIPNLNNKYNNSLVKVITDQKVIVYDNTGHTLEPFAELEVGIKYPIVSDYGNWYRVLVANRVGYINKEAVSEYVPLNSNYFEVTTENLPVYDNRTGSLVEIGSLVKGQVFERVSDYGNWQRIDFGNIYGYVRKSGTAPSLKERIPNYNSTYKNSTLTLITTEDVVVYDNTTGSLISFAEIKEGVQFPIASNYGNWYRILLGSKVGYVHKDKVKLTFTRDMKYFKVTKEGLPIYDNRSGSLIKVGTLNKNQTYERVSDYGNWHKIDFGNYYGYVRKSDTEPSSKYYKNQEKQDLVIGELTPKVSVEVFDNTGKWLTPFATILKGKSYPIVRDYGNWYEINISGRYGFIRKSDVEAEVTVAKEIVNPKRVYTYEDMRSDINQLAKAYPNLITWTTIGKSVEGRYIYAIKLGTGKNEVYFNGSTHAREWITTNLLMEMIDEYSQAYVNNQNYHGYNVKKILDNTSIWFVPMVNPDGVTLVQKGPYSAKNPAYLIGLNKGSTDFKAWKANIRGVDLNRQYPTDWNYITNNPGRPSPFNFKGYKPLTEPEAIALMNFSKEHNFKTEVAYHSSGEILYFGDDKFTPNSYMYNLSKKVASMVSSKTGYSLYYTRGLPGGGTYTDWVQGEMKRVALTPEVSPYVGNRPVPISSFDSIWRENNTIGLMIAEEAYLR